MRSFQRPEGAAQYNAQSKTSYKEPSFSSSTSPTTLLSFPFKTYPIFTINSLPSKQNLEYGKGRLENSKRIDRKSTRLNSSHVRISYAVFCLKKKKKRQQ